MQQELDPHYQLGESSLPDGHVSRALERHVTDAHNQGSRRTVGLQPACSERSPTRRALLRDRGAQFVDAFEEIFSSEGLKIFESPCGCPKCGRVR